MNSPKDEISLEWALQEYFTAPAPGSEFLANLEHSLQGLPVAAPRPSLRPGWRWSFRPAVAILAVVFIFLIAFFVVGPERVLAAIQGLIRYIPGFGLVAENTPLRMLAEPISQTRGGVTLTVRQAILSPDKASILFSVKGIPPEALPQWTVEERDRICTAKTELRLPDGRRLNGSGGGSAGYAADNTSQSVYFFPPLPKDVHEAVWTLDCLPQTLTGKAPAGWEIPLRFVPAAPDLTQLPVMVISPAPPANGTPASQVPPPAAGENPLSLDQIVATQDGYIFIGKFRQILAAQVTQLSPQIRDANGTLQGYSIPGDVILSSSIDQAIEWAYQIREKEITWPITIRYDSVEVFCFDPNARFTFDTGPDPQEGQIWEINQTFDVGPCRVKVNSVQRTRTGYLIQLDAPANLLQVNAEIEGTTPVEIATRQFPAHYEVRIIYAQEPPTGKLSVALSAYEALAGPWQVQWQPAQK